MGVGNNASKGCHKTHRWISHVTKWSQRKLQKVVGVEVHFLITSERKAFLEQSKESGFRALLYRTEGILIANVW